MFHYEDASYIALPLLGVYCLFDLIRAQSFLTILIRHRKNKLINFDVPRYMMKFQSDMGRPADLAQISSHVHPMYYFPIYIQDVILPFQGTTTTM